MSVALEARWREGLLPTQEVCKFVPMEEKILRFIEIARQTSYNASEPKLFVTSTDEVGKAGFQYPSGYYDIPQTVSRAS